MNNIVIIDEVFIRVITCITRIDYIKTDYKKRIDIYAYDGIIVGLPF